MVTPPRSGDVHVSKSRVTVIQQTACGLCISPGPEGRGQVLTGSPRAIPSSPNGSLILKAFLVLALPSAPAPAPLVANAHLPRFPTSSILPSPITESYNLRVGRDLRRSLSPTRSRTNPQLNHPILDGKPKPVIEAGEIGAKWVEVVEKKKASSSWSSYQKGQREATPYHRGQPAAPPTPQGKTQTPGRPPTPFSSRPPHPSDPSAGRCFKCNELRRAKANCPKNPNRLQLIAPASHPKALRTRCLPGSLRVKGNCECGREEGHRVAGHWSTVSAIHQSIVDPTFVNPEAQVTIQPFKSNSFDLPTAELPVQYRGWSGMWTFAVYDDYPIPRLLGEDLANHVKLAQRLRMVTTDGLSEFPHLSLFLSLLRGPHLCYQRPKWRGWNWIPCQRQQWP
ncbi:uncharacterized protein LOC142070163 [Caretta caretta]|uniref:uncharacterized protein LOC142070163 n=1 Tax=Caretta caretta TaxID=8467 RepID=UPI003F4B519B